MDNQNLRNETFADDLLRLALDVGEGMLKNGGEISRVEDTIERICRAYGAEHVEVFTIISVINASVRMKDDSYSSQMRRVKNTGMNLTVLEELNALSREVCHDTPSLEIFDEKVHELKNHKGYPRIVSMLAWALAAASFAVFFGGGIWECLWAALAGVAMFCIDTYSPKRMNAIAKNVMSAFLTSLIAGVSMVLHVGGDGSAIIMGSLMLLVPGVSIGTAMRDIFCGDLLAGTLRLLQSCLSALMLAFGYILAATLLGGGAI
ncbi:MAG: threonine/serine exporter family protein [Clostridia bacterium]|nr:threonine/serine exporter family protein [Clostridia bacterium]